ncbi:hypothetical protein WMY93_016713 [Mugilogobius chulae]|uniref:peptide-methionine (S)-S-oxide reductase n=1 Tax=Mugilogobius chulae TaxID=88201 RepID=A0AAW0NXU6_9GOBI
MELEELSQKGLGSITTHICQLTHFYYAEDYHQQYLHKVPKGYCGLKGTGSAVLSGPQTRTSQTRTSCRPLRAQTRTSQTRTSCRPLRARPGPAVGLSGPRPGPARPGPAVDLSGPRPGPAVDSQGPDQDQL